MYNYHLDLMRHRHWMATGFLSEGRILVFGGLGMSSFSKYDSVISIGVVAICIANLHSLRKLFRWTQLRLPGRWSSWNRYIRWLKPGQCLLKPTSRAACLLSVVVRIQLCLASGGISTELRLVDLTATVKSLMRLAIVYPSWE